MHAVWLARPALGGSLHDWLTAPGSLSERIAARCRGGFRVERLSQRRAPIFVDEARVLSLPLHCRPVAREVILRCGEVPVVFARSVVAGRDLDGPWRALRGLGSRPLATALFADPGIARGALEHRRIDARDPLYQHARRALGELPASLWARRSVFCRRCRPLLVTEVFLPRILELPR